MSMSMSRGGSGVGGAGVDRVWRASVGWLYIPREIAEVVGACVLGSACLHKVAYVVVGVARQAAAQQPRTLVPATARQPLHAAGGHLPLLSGPPNAPPPPAHVEVVAACTLHRLCGSRPRLESSK